MAHYGRRWNKCEGEKSKEMGKGKKKQHYDHMRHTVEPSNMNTGPLGSKQCDVF